MAQATMQYKNSREQLKRRTMVKAIKTTVYGSDDIQNLYIDSDGIIPYAS